MEVVPLLQEAFQSLASGQMPPVDLVKMLASKVLGYLVLVGACINKVPQILAVVRSNSAEGLSPLSSEIELMVLFITGAYGLVLSLPISAFGEAFVLLFQAVILLALIYKYQKVSSARAIFTTSVLVAAFSALLSGQITVPIISSLYEVNNLMVLAAKVPQIITNFSQGSTGQLSIITNGLNFVGTLVRIFTTIQEGAGSTMLRGYLIGAVLNGILVSQILFYSKKAVKRGKRKTKAA